MDGDMVVGGAEAVFGNMHVANPEFPFNEEAETVYKTNFAFPDGFYFSSYQCHAGIVFVFDEIIVVGGTVLDRHVL